MTIRGHVTLGIFIFRIIILKTNGLVNYKEIYNDHKKSRRTSVQTCPLHFFGIQFAFFVVESFLRLSLHTEAI